MTGRSTDAELDDMVKMIASGPGRRAIAGVEKSVANYGDNVTVQVKAGIVRVFAEELRLADLRTAKVAVELVEARREIKTAEGPHHRDVQVCNNCHHFGRALKCRGDILPKDDDPTVDVCRRMPPTMRITPHGVEVNVASFFPPVPFEGWCGHWERLRSRRVGQ